MKAIPPLRLSALLLTGACAAAPPVGPIPPVTSAMPAAAAELPPRSSSMDGSFAEASGYSGRGSETVQPDLLEKYRPRALRSEVSARIQSLMDVRAPGIGRLSPDGKAMFFAWSITGVPQVWKLDGPRRFPRELTGGADPTLLAAITPDGRSLVLQRDRKGEENPGLYIQSALGGPLDLVQHVRDVQTHFEAVSSDSRYVYFTSNDKKPDAYALYRWDIVKKEKQLVFDQPEGLWHVSDSRDDGRLLLRKETGSLTAEYWQWEPGAKRLSPIIGQGEKEEYDARYGARDGELVVSTNKLGEYRRLYDWVDGGLTPLGADAKFDVDEFDVDRARTRILYTINENGFARLHALDARTLKPLRVPDFPDAEQVTFGPTTPDGHATTIGVDDGRHPTQGYVLDWTTAKVEAWHAPSSPEIDTAKFARAQLDFYPARDGTKIPVLVRRPEKCATTPCPVILAFHGGPEAQARPGFSVGAQTFVDAGFVFVEPNVRGSDGFGKTWQHADDGPKRLDVITDIDDAGKWARVAFSAGGKAPRVGIYGGSYGGYSVLMGMTMFAGAYDAGVDVVGISDLRTFLRNTAPYRRVLRVSEYGDPERDAEALTKLSPMTYVDRARAPLLIVQGASDPRVPVGEAVQIHDALDRRGVECDLMIFPDEGHGAQKRDNRVLMLGHAVEFFSRVLDAPAHP